MSDEPPLQLQLPLPEPDDVPFQLRGTPTPARKKLKGGRPRAKIPISAADLKLLESVVHREDYTRPELAAKFGLSLKQLQTIIREKRWSHVDYEDTEDCEPFENPDPAVFIPCPYEPGSEGKLWFLEERFAKRLPLWHPKDRREKTPYQTGNLL